MKTAVTLIFFNRPEKTRKCFDAIREAKPPSLVLFSDGPRPDRPGEKEKILALREEIRSSVDWECEVVELFPDSNLGCGRGPAHAITETFARFEEAIILEDDCIAHPSFFVFCEELLERFRDDKRVMSISGQRYMGVPQRRDADYFFSRYHYTCGWATWRRAWKHFDPHISAFEAALGEDWLRDVFDWPKMFRIWRRRFEWVRDFRDPSIWDFQWYFACFLNGGLSVSPHRNLVENIGFDHEATHITDTNRFPVAPMEGMTLPVRHPGFVLRDRKADRAIEKIYFNESEILYYLRSFARWLLRRGNRKA